MLLIVAVFKFDLTGYNKRIPDASKVERVYVNNSFNYYGGFNGDFKFEDEENIELVRQLHKGVVDKDYDPLDADDYGGWSYVSFNYELKNGKTLRRTYYDVPYPYWGESKELKALYESREFTKQFDYVDEIDPRTIEVYNQWNDYSVVMSDKADMKQLLVLLEEDIKDRSFEENLYGEEAFINIWVEINKKNEYGDYYDSVSFTVGKNCRRVLSWLEEKGYLDELFSSMNTDFMVLAKDPESYYESQISVFAEHGSVPDSYEGVVVVTDPEIIKNIALNSAYGYQYNRRFTGKDGDIWGAYFRNAGSNRYYENRTVYVDVNRLPAELKAELRQYKVIQ